MNNKKRKISRCTIIAITLIIIFSAMLSGSFFAIKDDAVLQQKLHDNTIAGVDSFQSGYNGTQNYEEYEESFQMHRKSSGRSSDRLSASGHLPQDTELFRR